MRDRALDLQPLCARCEGRGLIAEANTVHHKTPVDWRRIERTLKQPVQGEAETWRAVQRIQPHAVDPDNLECLCRDCHETEHGRKEHPDRAAIRALGSMA